MILNQDLITNQLFIIHFWQQRFQNNSEGYAVSFGTPERYMMELFLEIEIVLIQHKQLD